MPSAPAPVLTLQDARHCVERHAATVAPRGVDATDLLSALGRVLAEAIVADRDFPAFARSTRDGFALRACDLASLPARLEIVAQIKAGDAPESAVGPGQAAEIMTGAALPRGADAVVMVEHTAAIGDLVVDVLRAVSAGDNFVPRGAEAAAGQVLIPPGRPLDPSALAILASVGKDRVQVFQRPRVAVLSTGDEVVEMDATPGPTQIRNSNSYSLSAQVQAAGGEAVRLPIAPDQKSRLRDLIEEGLTCDLLLLSGGVSMGKYDLVEQVLAEMQAEFYFSGAEIQPGRPVVFGSCSPIADGTREEAPAAQKKYFFGLPGNPVSTMVTFELFARPMLEALAGLTAQPLTFLHARLGAEIRTKTGLTRFLPAVLSGEFENADVELARWLGSGDIAALARANCYIVVPPDRDRIAAGEWVAVMMR